MKEGRRWKGKSSTGEGSEGLEKGPFVGFGTGCEALVLIFLSSLFEAPRPGGQPRHPHAVTVCRGRVSGGVCRAGQDIQSRLHCLPGLNTTLEHLPPAGRQQ